MKQTFDVSTRFFADAGNSQAWSEAQRKICKSKQSTVLLNLISFEVLRSTLSPWEGKQSRWLTIRSLFTSKFYRSFVLLLNLRDDCSAKNHIQLKMAQKAFSFLQNYLFIYSVVTSSSNSGHTNLPCYKISFSNNVAGINKTIIHNVQFEAFWTIQLAFWFFLSVFSWNKLSISFTS